MSFPAVEISKVANFINGFAFKPEDWEDSGLPIIRIQNLTDPTKPYNFTTKKMPKKYLVRKGDILVSWSATIDVFEWEQDNAILNQHIFKVEFDQDKIDKNYFKKALQKTILDLSRYAHGSTMKHVVKKDFESHKIPLPTLNDQKRIAYLLGKVEGLIAQRKQHLQQLDDLLKSVFLEMFGDPVRNEKGWEIKTLGKIASIERGRFSPRPRNDPKFYNGAHPFIQTGDISRSNGRLRDYTQTLNDLGTKVSKEFKNGTIVIAIVGATIGETAILEIATYAPDSVIGITPKEGDTATESVFVEYILRFWKPVLRAKAPEAARANINIETLRPLPIIWPRSDERTKFATIAEKVEGIKARYQQSLADLENLYGALSQKAFKGEMDLSRIPLTPEGTEATAAENPETNEPLQTVDTFDLPVPSDLVTLNSAEGRNALLDQWLTVWLEHLNDTPFSTQLFIDTAQQRLWKLTEDSSLEWELGTAEYNYVRAWILESLDNGQLAQTYNDANNQVQLMAVGN